MSQHEPETSVEDFLFVPFDLEKTCVVPMRKSQSYSIKLSVLSRRTLDPNEPTPHSAKLGLSPEFSEENAIAEAAQAASEADVAVVFAGRNAEWESEGSDLTDLKLPRSQDALIKSIAEASKRTVVVLYGGNPFDVSDWIESVDAVIFAQYPGQEGAAALADMLAGVTCPSGKLPMTWPKNIESAPTFKNFPPVLRDRNYELDYHEGLKVGYRHYSAAPDSARWMFGHGLSYTKFEFADLKVKRNATKGEDGLIELEVKVRNVGSVAGAEVVQAYVKDLGTALWRPLEELRAFDKVFLQPGEEQLVTLGMLQKYAFSYWDERSGRWVAEAGEYQIRVEDMVTSFSLEETFVWNGL